MTDVPEALLEKAADALVSHPSIPANLNETMFYCPACGADEIAGPNSPTHALHQARAVLAAVLPAIRPVVDRDALAEWFHEREHKHRWPCTVGANCANLRVARYRVDSILASGVVQDAATVASAARAEALRAAANALAQGMEYDRGQTVMFLQDLANREDAEDWPGGRP